MYSLDFCMTFNYLILNLISNCLKTTLEKFHITASQSSQDILRKELFLPWWVTIRHLEGGWFQGLEHRLYSWMLQVWCCMVPGAPLGVASYPLQKKKKKDPWKVIWCHDRIPSFDFGLVLEPHPVMLRGNAGSPLCSEITSGDQGDHI